MMAGDDRGDAREPGAGDLGGDGGAATGVTVTFDVVPRLNIAFHQNGVPVLGSIELRNTSAMDIVDLIVTVTSEPSFLVVVPFPIDRLRAGETRTIPSVVTNLDPGIFLRLTEAVRASVTCTVTAWDREVGRAVAPCELMAPTEWTGMRYAPELLGAFVCPNDPAVDVILRNAAEKLRMARREPALAGYGSGGRPRVLECAEALWGALCDERIAYALPPASFELEGQKVRLPATVVGTKIGTCLDLTLLYAACLEQMGFHPLVVLLEGHALVGVWLEPTDIVTTTIDEPQLLRKRIALDELRLIETTMLTVRPAGQAPVTFLEATAHGESSVRVDAPQGFEVALDVHRARIRRIRPLSLAGPSATVDGPVVEAGPAYSLGDRPELAGRMAIGEGDAERPAGRLERWKRRLLDLSMRNKLLNFKAGKGTIEFLCPDAGALEDRLAGGASLRLLPDPGSGSPEKLAGVPVRPGETDANREPSGRGVAIVADRIAMAADALTRDAVHTTLTTDEIEARVLDLYRTVRTSMEETGANNLYLAIGFVSWTPRPTETRGAMRAGTYRAPLLLVPVALERKGVRSGFTLRRHDEPATINPTFLEMLRQDFRVQIPELDSDLPVDGSGLDVRGIWTMVRTYLKELSGFEVTEEVALSTFSFAKFLMWKQLGDQAEALLENPVVRHLVETRGSGLGDDSPLPEAVGLDHRLGVADLKLPLVADSSQTAAIVAATEGRSFVLYGPPGTGKSQTISNLIAHLLSAGKTVLFVSQKATALEVVRRRLERAGLGPFCLEVHSAKAQKSAVLDQLRTAWEFQANGVDEPWRLTSETLQSTRDQLNAHVEVLHRRWPNGMSAYVAFGQVIAGRTFAPGLTIECVDPGADTEETLRLMAQRLTALADLGQVIGSPSTHPLRLVGKTVWTPVWQREFLGVSVAFIREAPAVLPASVPVAEFLDVAPTGNPARLQRRHDLVDHLQAPGAIAGYRVLSVDRVALRVALDEWVDALGAMNRVVDGLARAWRETVWELDFDRVVTEWEEASGAFVLVAWWRTRLLWQAVAMHVATDVAGGKGSTSRPADTGAELRGLREIAGLRAFFNVKSEALERFGTVWAGPETDLEALREAIAWADRAVELARDVRGGAVTVGLDANLGGGTPFQPSITPGPALGAASVTQAGGPPPFSGTEGPPPPAQWLPQAGEGSDGDWLTGLRQRLDVALTPSAARTRERLAQARAAFRRFAAARVAVEESGAIVEGWPGIPVDDDWISNAVPVADGWVEAAEDLPDWCAWQRASSEALQSGGGGTSGDKDARGPAHEVGLGVIINAFIEGSITAGQMPEAGRLAYARGWIDAVVNAEAGLNQFRSTTHERVIQRFREFDERLTELAAGVIKARLASSVPSRGQVASNEQWMLLARELQKRRGHLPIRTLIARIPDVVPVLAPCLMMSPLSIAQYLPARHRVFDVVVFDEASQLPVWDAIGAIARGSQVIVAGDPKQLPPTNFFERADTDAVDPEEVEDLESVLDECLAARLPEKRLIWHYRSRDEGLIAFSNQRYYDGQLITFPSPVSGERAVRYVHVPGTYDRGGARTNIAEARAVVADVVRRLTAGAGMSLLPTPSIGIVTFNAEQARLIENLLEKERQTRPDVEARFGASEDGPVFIKNLETVQGDERDVILFSIGYGPDGSGRVYRNFGPLNLGGGARRLNVAITRARRELVVFGALRADDITLTPTTPAGVRDFKHFLDYAERGPVALAQATEVPRALTESLTESPFETAVMEVLQAKGWEVRMQVGVSSFRIDLAVVHPDHPGRYLAGIEFDGATYHRSATARDRDRLREAVLRDLGWKILRVWSTDWWVTMDRAATRLHDALNELLAADRQLDADHGAWETGDVPHGETGLPPQPPSRRGKGEQADTDGSQAGAERFALVATPPASEVHVDQGRDSGAPPRHAVAHPPYVVTDIGTSGIRAAGALFYEPAYQTVVRQMVALVIATEGPVFDDVLVKRVADAHGFGRAGTVIRQAVLGAVDRLVLRTIDPDGRKVFWPAGITPQTVVFRRAARTDRKTADIPFEELVALARTLDLDNLFDPDALEGMRQELELERLQDPTRSRVLRVVNVARTG